MDLKISIFESKAAPDFVRQTKPEPSNVSSCTPAKRRTAATQLLGGHNGDSSTAIGGGNKEISSVSARLFPSSAVKAAAPARNSPDARYSNQEANCPSISSSERLSSGSNRLKSTPPPGFAPMAPVLNVPPSPLFDAPTMSPSQQQVFPQGNLQVSNGFVANGPGPAGVHMPPYMFAAPPTVGAAHPIYLAPGSNGQSNEEMIGYSNEMLPMGVPLVAPYPRPMPFPPMPIGDQIGSSPPKRLRKDLFPSSGAGASGVQPEASHQSRRKK